MKRLIGSLMLVVSLATVGCTTTVAVKPPRPGLVLVNGVWVAPPRAGAVWVEGHWERRGFRNRVWVPGHWRY